MDMKLSELLPGQSAPHVGSKGNVRSFERNEYGRDFVVGDIHGMFPHLERLLDKAGFAEGRDRLFSVGDLVDRGPHSAMALEWLDFPWFFACCGNHEQFVIDSEIPEQADLWVTYNGGGWWLRLSDAEQISFRERFRQLPLAMEIVTGSGLVGLVHADVPPMIPWDRYMDLLRAGNQDATYYAMWSRDRVQGKSKGTVQGGVARVYCGHSPVRQAVAFDNVYFIDTGAAYIGDGYKDAKLTLIEIHPEAHRVFSIRTAD